MFTSEASIGSFACGRQKIIGMQAKAYSQVAKAQQLNLAKSLALPLRGLKVRWLMGGSKNETSVGVNKSHPCMGGE